MGGGNNVFANNSMFGQYLMNQGPPSKNKNSASSFKKPSFFDNNVISNLQK